MVSVTGELRRCNVAGVGHEQRIRSDSSIRFRTGSAAMMRGDPVISVIIPTHDRSAAVVRAIDSARASTGIEDLEVVVVDDGSTDNTPSILAEAYGRDDRVRCFVMPRNVGPSGARNRGFLEARGEFILFLDSDDVLKPAALAWALQAFRHVPAMQFLTLEGDAVSADHGTCRPRIVRDGALGWHSAAFNACVLNHALIDPPPGIASSKRLDLEFGDLFPAVVFGDMFWLSGLLMRRTAARDAGPFNMRYRNLGDWDFTARLCLAGIGGYLDHDGFRRETGRTDQLSRAGNKYRTAVMYDRILTSLRNFDCGGRKAPKDLLDRARGAADYRLACRLIERHHRHRAQPFLWRAFGAGHRPLKALIRLIGADRIAGIARQLPRRSSVH